jgi:hypothetical protein
MIRLKSLVFAALFSLGLQAYAHEGHDHEEESLTEQQLAQIAAKALPSLVQSKKVNAAWSKAQRQDITITSAAGKDVWVVTYKNPDGKVDGGKPLNLVFDDLGNFVEANHTAK